MILGVSDHSSFEVSLKTLLEFASKLATQTVELKSDRLELLSAISNTHRMPSIKNLLNSYDFKYFVHAPSIDVNLASLNPDLRKASERAILRAVNLAAETGAKLLVSHVGRLSRDYSQKLVEKSVNNAASSLKTLARISNELGIVFTIENDHGSSDRVLAGYPEQIKLLLESIGCKLTLDVGHANTLGKIEDFLKLDKFIVNVHLHDNNGARDEHLAPGKGNIDFSELFRVMKNWQNHKPLIIECHSFAGLSEGVEYMRREFARTSRGKKGSTQ